MIEELDADEIDAFLRRQVVGRVGCHADGRTYVVPVIYAWDGEAIYVQSVEGRKVEMMRTHPDVCFEVDEYVRGGSWSSVIVEGTYEELDGSRAAEALALLVRRFAGAHSPTSRRASTGRAPVAFRVRPTLVSGRRVERVPRLAPALARWTARRNAR